MKKILLFLFAVALSQVANAETLTVDGINYNIVSNADFTCEVTSGNYSGGIAIPETIEDYGTPYTVVGIGSYAFEWCDQLLNVIIPETVTYINNYAFYYCTNLTKVTLPESLTSIGNYAFYECSSLTEITIPENVTSIGNNAFNDCYSLTTLNFNAVACTSCSSSSFPSSITTVNMGNKVTIIPPYFYYKKTALTSIDIPTSVTEIGEYAYYGCTGLTEITIPKNVKTINSYAFWGCENLTEVTIPESITTLASCSFGGCNFVTLNFNATSCEVSGWDSPFYESTKINTVNFGSKVTKIPDYFLLDATRIRTVTLPSSLISIGYGAFSGCTGLSEIVIPDKVTTIGGYAFSGCSNITSATIGEAVTLIDYDAFYNTNIETLNFNAKNYTNSMGNNQFPSTITTLNIGENVTTIGNYAFSSTNIETLNFNAKNCTSSMNNSQFPSTITTVNIGEKVKTIPAYFCYDCTGLTEVVFPDRVTTIGQNAFYSCTNLENLTFGYGLTTIGNEVIGLCYSMKNITSYNTTPPAFGSGIFYSFISTLGVKATVDKTAVSAYKTANIWSYFTYDENETSDFTDHNLHAEAMNVAYDTEDELENIWTKINNYDATANFEDEYNDILADILAIETAIDEAYQNGTISAELVAGYLESLESLNAEIDEMVADFDDYIEDEIDATLETCGELLEEIAGLLEEIEDDNTSFVAQYEDLVSLLETYTQWRAEGWVTGEWFLTDVDYLLSDIKTLRSDIRSYLGYSDAIEIVTIDNAEKVEVARYNLQGQRLTEPQRGINIIRYSDGSTQKVLVK